MDNSIHEEHNNRYPASDDRAWIELDLDSLGHNVRTIESALPAGCRMMAVVKAEAYGHGAFEVSAHLNRLGVDVFAVATIDEGVGLRRYGIRGEILVLGYTSPRLAGELYRYDLTQTLISSGHAALFNEQGFPVKTHIKIDTGMHRLGFDADDECGVLDVFEFGNLKVTGMFTHLCVADSLEAADAEFTQKQIRRFYNLLDALSQNGIERPKIHIQSSYGLLNCPELECDYVREGVSLYGVLSSPGDETRLNLNLRPVLSLKSQIVLIRSVPDGETVGYGRTYTAKGDRLIAVLPIGYADGVPRNLSGGCGEAIIRGLRAPIVGRICMDQLTVDITSIPGAAVGDVATLIGRDGGSGLSAEEVAGKAGTITNELLSRLGSRLKVITKNG